MDNTPYVWTDHISSYGDGDVCVVKYYTHVPAKNQTDRKIELSGYGTARHHPTDRPDDVTAKTLAAVRALKDLAKNLEDYARSRVDYNDSVREKARKTQQAALERIRERKSLRNSI